MKLDLQDWLLRSLIVVAGGLSAILLAMKGYAPALPALALGAGLGSLLAGRFGTNEDV